MQSGKKASDYKPKPVQRNNPSSGFGVAWAGSPQLMGTGTPMYPTIPAYSLGVN